MKQQNLSSTSEATKAVLMNHLGSFQNNDLEAVISDYSNESILVTETGTYLGTAEIQEFFTDFIKHFPKQETAFTLDRMEVTDSLGFIVWHASTPSLVVPFGTDTFIVSNGIIIQQTFAGKLIYLT